MEFHIVYVDNLGESSVNIVVRFWTPVGQWFGLKIKMLFRKKKALESEGFEIPFPQRVVWFANELKGKVE